MSHSPTQNRTQAGAPVGLLFYIAWHNLTYRRLRAILTIFGVVIGIGAIFFLLSFGLGLQHLVTQQIVGNASIKSIDVSSQNPNLIQLNDANVQKIKHLPHVKSGGVMYSFPGSVKLDGSTVDGIVYGVDKDYQTLANLNVSHGTELRFSGSNSLLIDQALLGSMGVKDYGSVIGKEVVLNTSLVGSRAQKAELSGKYVIAGVINDSGGNSVYVDSRPITKAGVPVYTQLKLLADTSSAVQPLRHQIESYSFVTSSPIDTIDQINQIFKFFNLILVGFGAIGMVVAVLGMFNTLTISLLERTREIGLMMALGGRRIDMRKLFIFEAVLLSVVGAVIGIVLAMLGGGIVNIVMNHLAHNRGVAGNFDIFATPLWLIAGSITFMVLVGLAVVYFPARRAERTDPIEAMRRE